MDEITQKYWDLFAPELKRESTRRQYLSIITEITNFTGHPFWQLDAKDAAEFYEKHKRLIIGQKYKGSTVYKKFLILHRFSEFIIKNRQLLPDKTTYPLNPFRVYLYYLKQYDQKNDCTVISLSEMDCILNAAKDDILAYTVISLIYRTAIRPNDLCRLKIGDFRNDPSGTYMRIIRDNYVHDIYVPDDMVSILDLYAKILYVNLKDLSRPLFLNSRKSPLNDKYLERLMERICEKAGITHYTPYDIRNSSAALLYAYGATDEEVANQLGIGIRFVQRYHSDAISNEVSRPANKMVNLQIGLPTF